MMNLLEVKKELCLNHRIKREHCRVCMDVCPKQAIMVGESPLKITFQDTCDQCGICLRHCPAEALQWKDTKRYPLACKDGKAEIYCRKLKCDGYVGCLANLNEYELVYLALQADISLCMDERVCRECNCKITDEVKELVERSNSFLKKIQGHAVVVTAKEKQAAEQMNRRELFSFFFTKMKQSLVEALPVAREATDYRLLLLGELSRRDSAETSNAAPLFFGLEAFDCTLCGICAKICKNKALTLEIEKEAGISSLKHNQSLCTGCGACEKICPNHALRLSGERSSLQRVCAQAPLAIAEMKVGKCGCCGAFIIGREESLCDSCRRKESKKMQAIY